MNDFYTSCGAIGLTPFGLYAPSGAPRGQAATPFALYAPSGAPRGQAAKGETAPFPLAEQPCGPLRRRTCPNHSRAWRRGVG